MESTTWTALTVALTVVGLIWTWIAFKRRGAANGLRALGFAVLPAAAWLTGTLQMVVEIGGSITDWATSLVFDTRTWIGVGLAGFAVFLWVVSGFLRDRALARAREAKNGSGAVTSSSNATAGSGALPRSSGTAGSSPLGEDEDIEALLRKRGIE